MNQTQLMKAGIRFHKSLPADWETLKADLGPYRAGTRFKAFETTNHGWIIFHFEDTDQPRCLKF